jgi:hypothetical protein
VGREKEVVVEIDGLMKRMRRRRCFNTVSL